MANLFSRFLGLAGIYDDDYEDDIDDEDYEEEPDDGGTLNEHLRRGQGNRDSNNRGNGKVINLRGQGNYTSSVVITKPEGLEEAQQISDYLKERRTVLLNLEEADPALARRIVDFLSGSVYALDADFQKASKGVFLIAPSNVEVQPLKQDLRTSRGFFPFASGGSYR